MTLLQWLRCRLGLHDWGPLVTDRRFPDEPRYAVANVLAGNSKKVCRSCGAESRWNVPRALS